MSETPQINNDQEIDLSQISKKIGEFFEGISTKIFRGFLFLKRNILWIGILFVLGAGMGFYFDKSIKVYDNEVIVEPNFGSTDYLYAKIDLINSKISDNDTLFLKEVVGLKDPKTIRKISIKPIDDVYKFVDKNEKSFELIKLFAEGGDIKNVVKESLTSKNYPYHLITFTTHKKTSDKEVLQPLLNFLNTSEYYSKIQKEYVNNVKIKMAENDSIISQINGVLNAFSTTSGSQKSDKLVYYNENTQLNDVIKTKDKLIEEQGDLRLDLVDYDKIVKDNSSTLNIKNTKEVNGKIKFVLPFLFVFLFIFIGFLKSYYKHQMAKLKK